MEYLAKRKKVNAGLGLGKEEPVRIAREKKRRFSSGPKRTASGQEINI